MQLSIDKNCGFSIKAQLAEQIKFLIKTGKLQPHEQLPTVRQLAGFLRINQNTVFTVYKELEREKFLYCVHGKGCFVAEQKTRTEEKNMSELLEILEEAITKAKAKGISLEEFALAAFSKAQIESRKKPRALEVHFIECNQADLKFYKEQLEKEVGVEIKTFLVDEVEQQIKSGRYPSNDIDLAVTTFFHLNEIKELLKSAPFEVIGIMAGPHIKTLMELSSLPDKTRLGIVCVSWRGVKNMEGSILNSGLTNVIPVPFPINDPTLFNEKIQQIDAVLTSQACFEEVKAQLPPRVKLFVYDRVLDQGGIQMLKSAIEEIQRKKQT
jgi:GntR family transcriptional regulator